MFEDDKKQEDSPLLTSGGNEPSEDEDNEVQNQFSKVAMAPQHQKIIVAAIIAVTAAASYFAFFGQTPSKEEIRSKQQQDIKAKKEELVQSATPVTNQSDTNIPAPTLKLPEPPPLAEPKPPEPPPPPLPIAPPTPFLSGGSTPGGIPGRSTATGASGSLLKSSKDDEASKKLAERRKSGIMVLGGKGGNSDGQSSGNKSNPTDPKDKDKDEADPDQETKKSTAGFLGFGAGNFDGAGMGHTSATQVSATYVGNTDVIVVQGKMINAVLETAINTDLPGTLRAVITRDVYAESGRNILVPKGSRVIGDYDSEIKDGQVRVAVNWTRVLLPGGVDIKIDSKGTDPLGRAGVSGHLDNKFWTRMGSAFMISYIIPLAMGTLTKTNKDQISTTTTTTTAGNPTTTTGGSSKALQMKEASDKFGKIAEEAIKNAFPTKPTITVDQGTEISIFVQKDIVFPASAVSNRTGVVE